MKIITPSMRVKRRVALTTALLVATATAACSTTSDSAGSGSADAPGVTGSTISLGVLTDNSGAFAAAGTQTNQGLKMYWDARNAGDKVCGREVKLEIRDHGYNAQTAVNLYSGLKDDVLAMQQVFGSPMAAALLPTIKSDEMLSFPVSWSSTLLTNPYMVIAGSTYDLEMINGISWLMDNKGLKKGDTIGHIFLEGDLGEGALKGSTEAAKEQGLKLISQKVLPTDGDLTAQVKGLIRDGAKHILLTTTPPQTASAVSIAAADGEDITFLGSNPSFTPALLDSGAKKALENSYSVVQSYAPFSSDAAADIRAAFAKDFAKEKPGNYVVFGYAQASIMASILEAACKDDADLTRPALLKAFQSLTDVDTKGLVSPLDYSKPGESPSDQVLISKPNAEKPGGLEVVQELFSAQD